MTTASVEATGLVKAFGDVRAVDGIDLEVRPGEIFGVLGPNGAGKTTMLRMLATLLPIDAGQARIFGVDVAREPHRVRQLVGVTGQYASVDDDLTATENLRLFGRLQGLPPARARTTAGELLAQFGLAEAANKPLSQFSGGMRRRLDLAASLITRPPRDGHPASLWTVAGLAATSRSAVRRTRRSCATARCTEKTPTRRPRTRRTGRAR
jgi:ABC-2 type transport system ATP-binding protein